MLPVFQIPGHSRPSRSPAAPKWRFLLILVSGKGAGLNPAPLALTGSHTQSTQGPAREREGQAA